MAHVEHVHTSKHVRARIRGREYRTKPEQNLIGRISRGAVRRLRICLLSAMDADNLERFGMSQPCYGPDCRHKHFTRDQIAELVASGELRWVGSSENVAAWRECRTLMPRPSGGVTVVQLVDL